MNLSELIESFEIKVSSDNELENLEPECTWSGEPCSLKYISKNDLNELSKELNKISNHINGAKKLISNIKDCVNYDLSQYIDMLKRNDCFLGDDYTEDDAVKEYKQAETNLKELVKSLYKLARCAS